MAQDPGAQRRAEAAALRAQAEKAAARDKRIKLLGSVAVAVVVVGIVLAGYLGAQASKAPEVKADPNAAAPAGTLPDSYGWPIKAVDASKSTLVIYEDPQCPICKQFEDEFGAGIRGLVDAGRINLVYQMAHFIDNGYPESKQSSRRSIAGLGCAIDQGVGLAYHDQIYANQPEVEGQGWTDANLKGFATTAGLSGAKLDAFNACFDAKTYLGWADNQNQYFSDQGIGGTPTLILDGQKVADEAFASSAAMVEYLSKNAK